MANLAIHINVSSTDQPFGTSGVDWVEFSEGSDKIIFSAGSVAVTDGANTPTQQELISAGIILTGAEIPVTNYFLLDNNENTLKSIDNMGDLDKRYVIAFDFDDATASEPVLEVWDDATFSSTFNVMLGGNGVDTATPSQSFIRGITTTNASAGAAGWTGTRLAGASSGNFLYLNDQAGALTAAGTLYATLKVIVPSTQTTGFSATPVFVCKFLSN